MTRKQISLSVPVTLLALALAAGNTAASVPGFRSSSHAPRVDPPDDETPPIEVVDAGYNGDGCPAFPVPSATIVLSADKRRLSILFSQYIAQTFTARTFARKFCNVAISLAIPEGYTVALLHIDYRGYASIPVGGRGTLRAEYFFAGYAGPEWIHHFPDGSAESFYLENVASETLWSECGEDVIARANTSIVVEKEPGSDAEAYLSVDSADVEAGVIHHLDWQGCPTD